ncbi:hypothetical protein B0H19DRAFT_1243793 [Mycena capillaripes]|nr:hypothetical protein B0H19DRAFT_1243793 [Mycena capillaripes]
MSRNVSKHTSDQQFIDSLSARQLMDFRNHNYLSKRTLALPDSLLFPEMTESPNQSAAADPIRIKIEPPNTMLLTSVKTEPQSAAIAPMTGLVWMCTLKEGEREIFELVSDSKRNDSDVEVAGVLIHGAFRSSGPIRQPGAIAIDASEDESDFHAPAVRMYSDDDESEDEWALLESDTHWVDPGITSLVRTGMFRATQKVTVERIEYPSISPIFRTPNALVIDLSADQFEIIDPKTNDLFTLDSLVRNAENDGWKSYGVAARAVPRQTSCLFLENVLSDPVGPLPHAAVSSLIPWRESFNKVIRGAKCNAIGSYGNKCKGAPIMKAKPKWNALGFNNIRAWRPGLFMYPSSRSIRKVLIVTNATDHNHPMPVLTNVSHVVKKSFGQCVKAVGVVGATVSNVDDASSKRVNLSDKTPSGFAPSLHSKRAERTLIAGMKKQKFPNGLDETGLFHMYRNALTKPLPERYIHGYIARDDGSLCVATCVPYLLKLLDDPGVIAFDGDTTYKRIDDKINEWELAIFVKIVLRAASVVRAYINPGSADFLEKLFNQLQRIKLEVTGKPMPLKRFVKGGNLLVMNSDMDGAQIIGITRSVMKYNDPEYSGIANDTLPEQGAPELVKVCWRHAKEHFLSHLK